MLLLSFSKWNDDLLSTACKTLSQEFLLPTNITGGMAEYRQSLCLSFFYKFFLLVRSLSMPSCLLEREASALTVCLKQYYCMYAPTPSLPYSTMEQNAKFHGDLIFALACVHKIKCT